MRMISAMLCGALSSALVLACETQATLSLQDGVGSPHVGSNPDGADAGVAADTSYVDTGPVGPGAPVDELPSCDEVAVGMPCCGDGICDGPETDRSCAVDCGAPVDECGDGACQSGEAQSCPGDYGTASAGSYVVVDTGQSACYDNNGSAVSCQGAGQTLSGQDAQYMGNQPAYKDNGDGTVTDSNTGLVWVAEHGDRMTWEEAVAGAPGFTLAGYDDWRLPTIKELYSLIDFDGGFVSSSSDSTPYIDTEYFTFIYGDEAGANRPIDAQYWSATEYVGATMNGDHTVFGVNFADGRIKGYGTSMPNGSNMLQFVKYVRGNPDYGRNSFVDQSDGTVRDEATGLVWQKGDSGSGMKWADAMAHCEGLELAGHDDWRLPDAKELQSIVDYSRAPAVTGTAAIDPVFDITDIQSFFWTTTTHLDGPAGVGGTYAVYVAFGQAWGYMETSPGSGQYQLLDVHGAGAQRSDPKDGDPNDYPNGHGPQGDVVRVFNHVRCVRTGSLFHANPVPDCGDGSCGGFETWRNCSQD